MPFLQSIAQDGGIYYITDDSKGACYLGYWDDHKSATADTHKVIDLTNPADSLSLIPFTQLSDTRLLTFLKILVLYPLLHKPRY